MWAISRSFRERSMKWIVKSSPAAVTCAKYPRFPSGKMADLRLSAAVTRQRVAGWRGARVRELHPQVSLARGFSPIALLTPLVA
ncbi:unnamed protein product [Spirodela intermedia]|uniref:Uncharacterized protein n=1 Tax=Spirodela intermedia TaxID=51605 RepID=A0ABN7EC33_SPIIN|nr:unnamed protein product [Spirodela intermedia]